MKEGEQGGKRELREGRQMRPFGQGGGGVGSSIRKHDHYTPARKIRRDVRDLTARNHPKERFNPMERHALYIVGLAT